MTHPHDEDESVLDESANGGDGLDAMDNEVNWKDEEAGASGEFEDLPDGEYVVRCEDTGLDRTKTTKKPRFFWKLKVAAGKYKNRVVWKENILEADKAKWLKGDLKKAGLEIAKAAELRERQKELHGRLFRVKLDTVREYQRVYINGIVKPEDVDDAAAGPSVIDDAGGDDDAVTAAATGADDAGVIVDEDDDGTPF